MTDNSDVTGSAGQTQADGRSGLMTGVRHLTYAWIGAVGIVGEEVGEFYKRCVARGEQVTNEARESARSRRAQWRSARQRETPAKTEQPVDALLDRSGLATKSEINALIDQVDALSREVDALAQKRNQQQQS